MLKVADKKKTLTCRSETFWPWVGDRVLPTYPMTRPYIGDFYEEAAAHLLQASRLGYDSQVDVCPDLIIDDLGIYLECKSVGKSNASLLYEHRIEKYERFMSEGRELYYVFWKHDYRWPGVQGTTLFNLRDELARATRAVALVPAFEVHRAAMAEPQQHTSHRGHVGVSGSYSKLPARRLTSACMRLWFSQDGPRIAFVRPVYGRSLGFVAQFGSISLSR